MRAAGYVRVRPQEQVESGYNLEADRTLIGELCERYDWQLVEIYDDGGRQGDDPDRPGLLRLPDDLERFDVIVIRSQDRNAGAGPPTASLASMSGCSRRLTTAF